MNSIESFSARELTDIHFVYGFYNGNSLGAQREYRRRFPNRRIPGRLVFETVHRNLAEYGNFRRARGQGRPQGDYDLKEALNIIHNDPQIGLTAVSRTTGIPRSIVGRLVRTQGLHAYHFQRVQELLPADFQPRVEFCEWIRRNGNLLSRILWTDEATFTRNGTFNMHNSHFWSDENPRMVRRTNFQRRFSVNMWAGVINDKLIGPVELPPRLTSELYLDFLRNQLGDLLEDVPLNVRARIIYQHDGAPAHYGRIVREHLDEEFPGRWMGRNGPVLWPPRSPDLNPIDFHIWGNMVNLIYEREGINDREELVARINLAANQI